MTPAKVIETLLALGITTKGAFGRAKAKNGSIDWAKFLKSNDYKLIQRDVKAVFSALKKKDLDNALIATRKKQKDFLHGRSIAQLSTAELLQFNDLADIEILLVNKKLKQLKADDAFFGWLVEEALPVLLKAAKAVIPLLL